ncbi:SMI1/KNR4 family protein [Microbulbifer elongatus]|uniref:SMI1/KNR4 family protein n=1 Tax=Microbulbifer elongatus TaxID=86173 RepID=A0ABT1NVA8_9GAMM|nr:SMI1/KNR4 family protein [Microbulbifer elongatus]MCQ3827847.1 SMI1/KNR4 family protein [Microbulbifer elongatus]
MNQQEVEFIEEKTGINLPECYKQVVLNYPGELLGTEAEDYELLNDPEVIIEENNEVRNNGYFGESWPAHYFIIGQNGCGDYYVVNLENREFSVGFACHEEMACHPYAASLSEFISKYLQETK